MRNLTVPVPLPLEHPLWCDRTWCETTPTDTHHCSTFTEWSTRDGEFAVSLRRTDEPGWRGGTELSLFMGFTAVAREGSQTYLSPAEARQVARHLLAAADQADSAEGVQGGGRHV